MATTTDGRGTGGAGERARLAGVAGPTSTRQALTRFALASLVVAVAVGVAGALVGRRAAQTAATDDARTVTEVLAHSVIIPNLTDALVDGDPAAVAKMDQAVVGKVTAGSLVRVKLWTPEGRIVYSDEHRLIGASYPLAMDEQAVLRDNSVEAELSDLTAPENRFERDQGRLLEVYLPVPTPGGDTLLFETYSRYSSVTANAGAMWRQFLPITLGALLLLQLFQLPLVWSTARRLDTSLREREGLLRRAVEATDTERRRIARDLHDGVVQDLAAANYSLVGAKAKAAANGHKEEADALDGGAQALRRGIRSLRTLLVEIYPPSLHRAGLPAALRDLLDPLTGRGIEVRLQVPDTVELGDDRAELVFRVAQEAVRNVAEHSAAGAVDVQLEATGAMVALTVADDGIGFDPARLDGTPAGGLIRVLLVDDHRLVRAGLQSLLDATDDIRVAGTAADGQEALEVAAEVQPDVVLMDLSMPRMGGVEATRRLLADHPGLQVVVLTSFSDQEQVLDAVDAGAVGYLLKDADPTDLVDGVRAAAAGQSPLDPKVARTLLTRRATHAPQDQLSDRELEVLGLVADGLANKQIARHLGISERTVKAHLTSVFQRIGVTDRTQAALWAERNGLRRPRG